MNAFLRPARLWLVAAPVLAMFGCTVEAVVGVERPSDAGSDSLDLLGDGPSLRDVSPDAPGTVLAGDADILCSSTEPCPFDEFCSTHLGSCETGGHCATIPSTCTSSNAPVCGCDDKI